MASLNKVLLIGNLTKDPELRYTPGGTAVANLRVAVNRKFKDRAGELKEDTCFVTVTGWDKQAEDCRQYLHKGRSVFVEGTLQSRSWDGPDGKKHSAIDVRAERVQFLDAPGGAKGVDRAQGAAGESDPAADAVRSEDMAWEE